MVRRRSHEVAAPFTRARRLPSRPVLVVVRRQWRARRTAFAIRRVEPLPEQISQGTLLCSKCAVCFQKAIKNANRLTRSGPAMPAEEMAVLWFNSPELLGWILAPGKKD